jgi:hypothetical protein
MNGPTLSQLKTAYSGQPWISEQSLFTSQNGIQYWTVPKSGFYNFVVAGASSEYVQGNVTITGKGAILSSTDNIYLDKNDIIIMIIGQKGVNKNGGGGTFVFKTSINENNVLFVAGGGSGTDASLTNVTISGTNGASGVGCRADGYPVGVGGLGGQPNNNGKNGTGGNDKGSGGLSAGGKGGMGGSSGKGLADIINDENSGGIVDIINRKPSASFGGGGSKGIDGIGGPYSGGGGAGGGGGGGYIGGGVGGGVGGGAGCWGGGGSGGIGSGGGSYSHFNHHSNALNVGDGYVTITSV